MSSFLRYPSTLIRKIGSVFHILARSIYEEPKPQPEIDEVERTARRWMTDGGDKTFRVQYDLEPSSHVLDLGGYQGSWAAEINSRYDCKVEVFEPVEKYASEIEDRFKKNPKIHVHRFGLGSKDEEIEIAIDEFASSIYKQEQASRTECIEIKKASEWLAAYPSDRIDLIKINIEGSEYDLLDHLISEGLHLKLENIQVQFHNFVPAAKERMDRIKAELAKTHSLTYEYEFVWENWKLNAPSSSL